MAISFQTSATGTKATTGTTFTIALSSTAGDQIIVVITSLQSANFVSGITDGGGNSYHRVSSVAQAGTTTEVWATPSHPAASGTLTVTVNASGFRVASVAASYRGVDVIDVVGTGTGSTSPLTSGSTALRDVSSWLLTGGGMAAANAFTAQNGSLRNQITVTGNSVVLIDSNGAASPVTDSATMTAAAWGVVNIFLRTGTGVEYYVDPIPPRLADRRALDLKYAPSTDFASQFLRTLPLGVSFQTSATGSAGTGTSFTIPLNSMAGDQIIVAVVCKDNSLAVTSITDNGGNTYSRIASSVQGGLSLVIEIWRSNSAYPAASGTITVNGSFSGLVEEGVAASYRNVDLIDVAGVNTGTGTPLTSGSVSLSLPDRSDWLLTVGGQAIQTTFTSQNGTIRNQSEAQVGISIVLIDSNGSSSPVTNSVGASAGVGWGAVSIFLRFGTGTPYYVGDPNPPIISGRRAFDLKYAQSDFVNQLQPPSKVSIGWAPQSGPFNILQAFASVEEDLNPGPVFPFQLGWRPLEFQPRRTEPAYALPAWDAPAKFSLAATVPPIPGWEARLEKTIPPTYFRPSAFDAPPKFGLIAAASVSAWQQQQSPFSSAQSYASVEEDLNPGSLFKLPNFLESNVPAWLRASFLMAEVFSSPPKFGLVTIAPSFVSAWRSEIPTPTFLQYSRVEDSQLKGVIPATFPVLVGWLPDVHQVSRPQRYAQPDFVNQISPTRILTSLGFLPYQTDRRVELLYSALENLTRAPFIPQISISGWFGTDGQKSLQLGYAAPTWDAPAKFGLAIASPITIAGWSPTPGQNAVLLKYALPDFVGQVRPTLATLPLFPSEFTKPGNLAVQYRFSAPAWDAPAKFGLIAPASSLISAWQQQLNPFSIVQPFASVEEDLLPGLPFRLPILPENNLAAWLRASYQEAEVFSPPPKFGLITIATPTVAGWLPTIGQNSVLLKYTPPDFVSQLFPTLALLPRLLSDITAIGVSAQPQKFEISRWDAPPKFGLVVSAASFISAWKPETPPSVFLQYSRIEDSQLKATISPIFFPTLLGWLPDVVANAQPQRYTPTAWEAPPKFGLVATVTPTIAGWLSTIGQNSILLKYALPDFVNQINPTLAALPLFPAELTKSGNLAVLLKYALPAWEAPPKFGLTAVVAPTLAGWSPTPGQNAVLLKYAPSDFINQIFPTLATLPLLSSELTKPADLAVLLRYAAGAFDAPAKFGLVAPPSLSGFLATEGLKAIQLQYALGAFDAPAKFGLVASPSLSGFLPTEGLRAVQLQYALGAFDAPPKFGLVAVVPPTLAAWTATIGQNAVVLQFASPDFINQIRATLATLPIFSSELTKPADPIVLLRYTPTAWDAPSKFGIVPPPPIPGWTPTLGQNAVLLNYALGDIFKAPEKVIPFIPALPTIESWTPTIGQNALPQKFALPEFFSPAKFGLVVYPTETIVRGMIFYQVVDRFLILYKVLDGNLVFYKILVRGEPLSP